MLRLASKVFFSFLWMFAAGIIGLVLAVVRFGHPNLDHWFAKVYAWGALKILRLEVEISGAEHLVPAQPCIYVANHQSDLDMAAFSPLYPPRTIVIGKKELLWIPVFGFFFWAAGNVLLDRQRHRKAVAGLNKAVDALKERGLSIWIFPEGTRNRLETGLLPFKKGAFHTAIAAQRPIVPIVCAPQGAIFSRNRRWIAAKGRIQVRILPPIPTVGMGPKDVEELTRRTRDLMLAELPQIQSENLS